MPPKKSKKSNKPRSKRTIKQNVKQSTKINIKIGGNAKRRGVKSTPPPPFKSIHASLPSIIQFSPVITNPIKEPAFQTPLQQGNPYYEHILKNAYDDMQKRKISEQRATDRTLKNYALQKKLDESKQYIQTGATSQTGNESEGSDYLRYFYNSAFSGQSKAQPSFKPRVEKAEPKQPIEQKQPTQPTEQQSPSKEPEESKQDVQLPERVMTVRDFENQHADWLTTNGLTDAKGNFLGFQKLQKWLRGKNLLQDAKYRKSAQLYYKLSKMISSQEI